MVRKTCLVLLVLFASACAKDIRKVKLCGPLDVTSDVENKCAQSGVPFVKKISELGSWVSLSAISLQIVAEKLAECDTNGHIAPGRTLHNIEICTIATDAQKVSCTIADAQSVDMSIPHIEGWYATDVHGMDAIKSKLNFCGEQN